MSTLSFNDYYEHFKDFIEESECSRQFVITEFDENKNLIILGIAYINNREMCAGHIGLYNASKHKMEIAAPELIRFLNYAYERNIKISYCPDYFKNMD